MSQLNWNALFANGSIVDLHTSMWRARLGIKPSDLGIDDTTAVQKVLSLGCHRLAPAKAFEDINEPAKAAARAIEHYSMNFGLIRGARYVPDTNLPKLLGALRKYKNEYMEAVNAFMDNYDKMKAEQMPIIRAALRDAAQTPEAAENAYRRIMAEYPSSNEVRQKFGLRWNVYAIQGAKSRAALAAATEESENVKGIVSSMVTELRSEMQDKLKKVLDIATKGGRLSTKTIESAHTMLDRIESLNVLGDQVLAQQIGSLRAAFANMDKGQVTEDFTMGLNQVQEALEASVEEAIAQAEQNLTGVGKRKLSVEEPAKKAKSSKEEARAR